MEEERLLSYNEEIDSRNYTTVIQGKECKDALSFNRRNFYLNLGRQFEDKKWCGI